MTKPSSQDTSTTKRRTILFVANTDWYLFNFRKNLLKRADSEGWKIRLACGDTGYNQQLIDNDWPVTKLPLSSRGSNPIRELWALYKLAQVFKRQKPDVAHLFTLKCVLYGCLAAPFSRRTQIVGALTGMGYLFTSNRPSARALKQFVVFALRAGLKVSDAHLIFQNEFDRNEFVNNNLLPLERTSVIRGSGVDCSVFNSEARRSTESDIPRLLFCGRLIEEKGIRDYLKATATLRDANYEFESRIAGEPYPGNPSSLSAEEITKLAQSAEHEYLGHYQDMPGLLADTDIVVLPTYYREGTPKVLLEAAAAGCLIVTTTIPACEGIVDQGINGFRVRPRDPDALSRSIAQLLDYTLEKRLDMADESRRIARERFSDEEVNRKTLALYDSPNSPTD